VSKKEIVQVKPVEKVEEKKIEPKKEEKFNFHYSILESMGFKDVQVTTDLLKKHNGNLQKAINELLGK